MNVKKWFLPFIEDISRISFEGTFYITSRSWQNTNPLPLVPIGICGSYHRLKENILSNGNSEFRIEPDYKH
jgi:hypothetical protein